MAVDLKSLKNHPGANPEYRDAMIARKAAQNFNRDQKAAPALMRMPCFGWGIARGSF